MNSHTGGPLGPHDDQPTGLDSSRWYEAFDNAQVPLYVSDVSALRQKINEIKRNGGQDFEAWLDAHPDFIMRSIQMAHILDVNQAVVKQLRAESKAEAILNLTRVVVPESLAPFKKILSALAAGRPYYEGESQILNLEGRPLYSLNRAKLPGPDENPAIMIMATTDITDLKCVQRDLATSRKRYRDLVEAAQDVILCHDLAGHITFVNAAGLDLTGWSRDELIGRSLVELVPERLRPDVIKHGRFEQGEETPRLFETVIVDAQGQEIAVEVNATLIRASLESVEEPYVLITARDITARRRAEQERLQLEARLRDTQKLESLAVLARGISHDFNNLLVTIMGNAELLRGDPFGGSERGESIDAIVRAANQAAELCRQMQAYAGGGRFNVQAVDLNAAIGEIEHLLKITVAGNAHLNLDLAAGPLPLVLADTSQIRQVIMNLVINGVESLAEDGGRVTLRTGVRTCGADELARLQSNVRLQPGTYVFCEISDDGAGMDDHVRSRLFEPFFSTRSVGRGIGLSASHGIIHGHGGGFLVESELGRGSVVTFLLPVHEDAADRRTISPRRRKAPDPVYRVMSGKTILVIGDDAPVRQAVTSTLRRLGSRVLAAADGQAAVQVFSERSDEIDAIVLDMASVDFDGAAVCTRLRTIRDEVPVVVMCGLDDFQTLDRITDLDPAGFLPKPFQMSQVGQVLGHILEG